MESRRVQNTFRLSAFSQFLLNLKMIMKFILTILFLLSAGCSGFKQSGLPSFDDENGQFSNVDYKLSIQTGPYADFIVVDQIRNSSIKILVPIGLNNFVPLGNFTSAQWSIAGRVSQDGNNFKTLEVDIPVSHVTQSVNAPLVTSLPNGDLLDFLPSGEARHISIPLDGVGNANLHVYLSPPYLLGVFIQTSFDLASSNKYSIAPVDGLMPVGFFSTHPHRPPLNGGSFVFISLPR